MCKNRYYLHIGMCNHNKIELTGRRRKIVSTPIAVKDRWGAKNEISFSLNLLEMIMARSWLLCFISSIIKTETAFVTNWT